MDSLEKPMLGGCCICLDERGWAENPLVYCDGKGCSIAVHQACYGIVSVPSGPWYCRRCEIHGTAVHLSCKLCPYQGGALKKADEPDHWAHVVCALYIPEVEFGNVSSMEPIVIKNLPEERFKKSCYICEEENRQERNAGACMDCAKIGCKLSFHVTCAQMSGLLCEVAGASNTTKYCGFCLHHFSKQKKISPFKNLACAKVYKLPFSNAASIKPQLHHDSTVVLNESNLSMTSTNDKSLAKNKILSNIIQEESCDGKLKNIDLQTKSIGNISGNIQKQDIEIDSNKTSTTSLSSLADVASCALQKENLLNVEKTKSIASLFHSESKKSKKKNIKTTANDGLQTKKSLKTKKLKVNNNDNSKPPKITHPISVSEMEAIGYATAPKHSVISLSEFGDSSLEPSHPSDIGKTKPIPITKCNKTDGLTAIDQLLDQQQSDLMKFLHEFGAPSEVVQLLQSLKKLKEENSQFNSSIEKMTYRRDQLLAIKARLSIPLHSSFACPPVCSNPQDTTLSDSKQFASSQHQSSTFSYYISKN